MDPFSITCHSCAVKLKVTNPKLVGQTLACPKCGTMIHVEHPTGWKMPIPDSVQSGTGISGVVDEAQDSNFDDIDDLLTSTQASVARPKAPPTIATGPTKPASRKQNRQKNTGADVPRIRVDEQPILPGDNWASKSARERKKLFLMIGSAAATVLLVAAIIFAIVKFSSSAGEQVANTEDLGQASTADSDIGQDRQSQGDDSEQDDGLAGDNETNNANEDGFLDDSSSTNPTTAIAQEGALGDVANSTEPIGSSAAGGFAAPNVSDPPELNMEESAKEPEPSKKKPVDLDDVLDGEKTDRLQKMSRKMGALAELLSDSNTSMRDLQDIAILLRRREASTTPKYSLENPRTRKPKLEDAVDLPTGTMEPKTLSLATSVRLLSSLSGAPASIDARQISMMGLPINPEFEFELDGKSMLEAFESLADQAGLQCLVGENTLTLTLPAETENSRAEIPLPKVGELSAEEKQRFVDSIKQLIATDIWAKEETPATASVEGEMILLNCPEGVRRHVQMLVDRINAAAVLSIDPEDDESRELIAARWSASETLRTEPTGWRIGIGLSIGKFLERVEKLHGLTVLVDWEAATSLGWTPQTKVPGDLVEPTVGESVEALAQAMGMSLIGIDATTVQLTSRLAAANALDLEVYPCDESWAANVESQEVEQVIFGALGGDVKSSFVRVVFEPKCRAVIVVAPQLIQRQVENLVKRFNAAATEK